LIVGADSSMILQMWRWQGQGSRRITNEKEEYGVDGGDGQGRVRAAGTLGGMDQMKVGKWEYERSPRRRVA
jgi:hypothetical protein